MYGVRPPTIPGTTVVAGGGVLAATGAPPIMWMLSMATALLITGALAYRAKRLDPAPTPSW